MDFGTGFKADIQKIRYSPNPKWPNPAAMLEGAKFQVSDDGSTWTTLFDL